MKASKLIQVLNDLVMEAGEDLDVVVMNLDLNKPTTIPIINVFDINEDNELDLHDPSLNRDKVLGILI